jgi:hypothetical protein
LAHNPSDTGAEELAEAIAQQASESVWVVLDVQGRSNWTFANSELPL